MKISIGSKIVEGPWGGGNLFAINLSNYLLDKGHEVIYDLSEPDIDLILLTDPRSRRESSSTFNHLEIKKYVEYVNPKAVVVQRINECDERKNTDNINEFYLNASKVADHVVFVSKWLESIYISCGMDASKTSVIYAGANSNIFNSSNLKKHTQDTKFEIVTHHWSSHENKGFNVYKKIDNMLTDPKWRDRIGFTYIGNVSPKFNLENSLIIKPLAGDDLASEIKKCHIYVTGSINEPSGNHHIEAAQCGLPVMYIPSGGIPEYCDNFGVDFQENDFEQRLEYLIDNYDTYYKKLESYPFNSDKMCSEFYELFNNLILKKQDQKEIGKISFLGKFYLKRNKIANKYGFIFSIAVNLAAILRSKIRGFYE